MRHFLLSFGVSAASTLLLVHASKGRGSLFIDKDFTKPQKFHSVPVSRAGGVGVLLGVLASVVVMSRSAGTDSAQLGVLLMACAMPAFLAGLYQDFNDTLTPRYRLFATALSAVLAYFLLGAAVRQADIPGLDWLLGFGLGSLVVTVLAVAGIANAVNIIDGLNGLASMCLVIMLGAIAYVAFEVGDPLVQILAVAGVGAVLGFFIWNFPAGLIFLGDGGAYFLGFYVAEVAILLLVRNPGVSPLFALLVCIYPVFETLFSIYRRYWLRSKLPSLPDGIHLHSLVYRRLMRWAVGNRSAKALTRRNSMSSPYLWLLCSSSVAPAVLFWDNPVVLGSCLLVFIAGYVVLYRRIVRFQSPRWLRISRRRLRLPVARDNPHP